MEDKTLTLRLSKYVCLLKNGYIKNKDAPYKSLRDPEFILFIAEEFEKNGYFVEPKDVEIVTTTEYCVNYYGGLRKMPEAHAECYLKLPPKITSPSTAFEP